MFTAQHTLTIPDAKREIRALTRLENAIVNNLDVPFIEEITRVPLDKIQQRLFYNQTDSFNKERIRCLFTVRRISWKPKRTESKKIFIIPLFNNPDQGYDFKTQDKTCKNFKRVF